MRFRKRGLLIFLLGMGSVLGICGLVLYSPVKAMYESYRVPFIVQKWISENLTNGEVLSVARFVEHEYRYNESDPSVRHFWFDARVRYTDKNGITKTELWWFEIENGEIVYAASSGEDFGEKPPR
jgi:hypothetical protein